MPAANSAEIPTVLGEARKLAEIEDYIEDCALAQMEKALPPR